MLHISYVSFSCCGSAMAFLSYCLLFRFAIHMQENMLMCVSSIMHIFNISVKYLLSIEIIYLKLLEKFISHSMQYQPSTLTLSNFSSTLNFEHSCS